MDHKFLTLFVSIGIACCASAINAQSPSPTVSASPAKHHSQKAKTSTAASSPTAATTTKRGTKENQSTATSGAGNAALNTTPAPGGGPNLVWVDEEKHVYYYQGSTAYGRTKKGNYLSENDAIEHGNHKAQ